MIRFLTLASFVFVMAVAGCSKPATTNVAADADQAAIDAYNAEIAKADAEMEAYVEPK